MRINRMILLQTTIGICVGLGVMYVQKRVGGPFGNIIPGVLGFLIGWCVAAAIPEDIDGFRRWLLRRRANRELQPK
jgi:hypothetical protein